eukprot:CAMPEP_0184650588 /NCGR_PEP_ID=MMETSP0308-20130426/8144_1 /TAXON_ID=38269 /ORGANISM="Gloeochaete witrockiana, Strain SAG 46.84" /LENGTH=109 /DNA_ID=CAMNT_0027084233 /DNA_START=28 /DNA_END=358 /DNA_ORIENTATION=+
MGVGANMRSVVVLEKRVEGSVDAEGDVRMKNTTLIAKDVGVPVKGLIQMEGCKVTGDVTVESVGSKALSTILDSHFRGERAVHGRYWAAISEESWLFMDKGRSTSETAL